MMLIIIIVMCIRFINVNGVVIIKKSVIINERANSALVFEKVQHFNNQIYLFTRSHL